MSSVRALVGFGRDRVMWVSSALSLAGENFFSAFGSGCCSLRAAIPPVLGMISWTFNCCLGSLRALECWAYRWVWGVVGGGCR